VPPARLTPPDPPLSDGVVRLRPLTTDDLAGMQRFVDDEAVLRITLIPFEPDADFEEGWLARYVDGWANGNRAGFAVEVAEDGAFAGFASLIEYHPEQRQGELGYLVAEAFRGRGLAARTLDLLADWCLHDVGLERVELQIDPLNAGSLAVARRCRFVHEGTLRNVHFKGAARCDLTIWSRLRDAPGAPARP
jgi:RimJ/RimL family protein N-acetyltransferase